MGFEGQLSNGMLQTHNFIHSRHTHLILYLLLKIERFAVQTLLSSLRRVFAILNCIIVMKLMISEISVLFSDMMMILVRIKLNAD